MYLQATVKDTDHTKGLYRKLYALDETVMLLWDVPKSAEPSRFAASNYWSVR
jgi:hypothetical protein